MPPQECDKLARAWEKQGVNVHCETIATSYGHDAFLIEHESVKLNQRLRVFLGDPHSKLPSGADGARELYNQSCRDAAAWNITV
jgi:hypothetical protein